MKKTYSVQIIKENDIEDFRIDASSLAEAKEWAQITKHRSGAKGRTLVRPLKKGQK